MTPESDNETRAFDDVRLPEKLYVGARLFGIIVAHRYKNLNVYTVGSNEQIESADKQLDERVGDFLVSKSIDPETFDKGFTE